MSGGARSLARSCCKVSGDVVVHCSPWSHIGGLVRALTKRHCIILVHAHFVRFGSNIIQFFCFIRSHLGDEVVVTEVVDTHSALWCRNKSLPFKWRVWAHASLCHKRVSASQNFSKATRSNSGTSNSRARSGKEWFSSKQATLWKCLQSAHCFFRRVIAKPAGYLVSPSHLRLSHCHTPLNRNSAESECHGPLESIEAMEATHAMALFKGMGTKP